MPRGYDADPQPQRSGNGVVALGKPDDYGRKTREASTQNDYHKVTDEVKPDWDLTGAIDDIKLLVTVGARIANAEHFPEWRPGAEFQARREAMLKRARP